MARKRKEIVFKIINVFPEDGLRWGHSLYLFMTSGGVVYETRTSYFCLILD